MEAMALAGRKRKEGTSMCAALGYYEIERRVIRACKTLRALPDKDRGYLRGGLPAMMRWQIVQDYLDAYGSDEERPRFRPTPFDVSDYLIALDWCSVLNKQEFRYIWWRSFDSISFKVIALRIGRSDETARKRYRDAILKVWHEANLEIDAA